MSVRRHRLALWVAASSPKHRSSTRRCFRRACARDREERLNRCGAFAVATLSPLARCSRDDDHAEPGRLLRRVERLRRLRGDAHFSACSVSRSRPRPCRLGGRRGGAPPAEPWSWGTHRGSRTPRRVRAQCPARHRSAAACRLRSGVRRSPTAAAPCKGHQGREPGKSVLNELVAHRVESLGASSTE